jgi:hypothetical protein
VLRLAAPKVTHSPPWVLGVETQQPSPDHVDDLHASTEITDNDPTSIWRVRERARGDIEGKAR